jgi:uncharacterized membrane protein
MVGAHVTDAWTREADRHDDRFFATAFVNGLAAPAFLLLAGVALAMAAESRARTIGPAEAARSVHQRGWQVFGLAFLFRVQSQLLGWGPLVNLLKVDILNVMGLAMIAAAWIWRAATNRTLRVIGYAAATVGIAFATPIVRDAAWPGLLPGPVEWYLRPIPNRTTFTLLPWAGFLTGGALAGELLEAMRGAAEERRLQAWLFGAGLVAIAGGYAGSLQPSIYGNAEFWTSSPTFFFIRLGIVIMLIPMAWAVGLSWEPLVTLGRSSLFVYWVHVELVYGALALPLRRLLPWEATVAAAVALSSALYALVHWKNRWVAARPLSSSLRILSPILK